jgi:hypothetical protein
VAKLAKIEFFDFFYCIRSKAVSGVPILATFYEFKSHFEKSWLMGGPKLICQFGFSEYTMCPADNATAGSLGRRRAGQLRFGFVAVLKGHIVSSGDII